MNTEAVNILSSLVGKKATIFKYSEMGFPQSIQCEIMKVYTKDYAQYKDCITVEYKPKAKRTVYIWRLFYYQTFAVFAGFVDLNANMFVTEKKENGLTIKEGLTCFSDGYLRNALSSTNQKPILLQNKENA